jgi:hypothetical protein
MRPRRAIAVGLAAALAGCGATVRADEPAPRAGATMRCADRSMASFPRAFADRDNLVVGPLVMVGAGRPTSEQTVREFGGNKFPLLVRNRHRVTVAVDGEGATLSYGGGPDERVTRFVACRRRSGSRGGRRPVTFWSGFVMTSAPRCVRLRVWVDAERSPRRAAIPLGRECPG